MFSFLPLAIAYQFLRFSNCYFLLVVILSSIPIVSPIGPATAINPFLFVISISLLREAFEDYARYKSDKTQNGQVVNVLRNSKFVAIDSKDLKVGDIVKTMEEETFPADLILLTTSNLGNCFIKTSSLDGEKNLKKRIQPLGLDKHFQPDTLQEQAYAKKEGRLECELPNKDLHSFKGSLKLGSEDFTMSDKQLLLKGA